MKKAIVSILLMGLLLTTSIVSVNASVHNEDELFFNTGYGIPVANIYVDDDAAPGGNGPFEHPFQTIAEGLKIYNEDKCCEGYMICSKNPKLKNDLIVDYFNLSSKSVLLDMSGKVIKIWNTFPQPVKMLSDGSIISSVEGHSASIGRQNLTQFDYEGNVIWNFNNWTVDKEGRPTANQHHDFQREGNPVGYYAPGQDFVPKGKTLILARAITYNPSVSYKEEIVDDVIYETNWNGTLTGFVWSAIDHIDEMGFSLKERIGIYLNPGGAGKGVLCRTGDVFHTNSVSYIGENKWYDPGGYEEFNPENIIVCFRHINLIVIIDRDTGNIVWKVGPTIKKTLEKGKLEQLVGPHHAHVIPAGLPGEGNILVFDNGGSAGYGLLGYPKNFRGYSKVIEFDPITKDIVWEYESRVGHPFFTGKLHKFYSAIVSSAQRLPNGNTFITEGCRGRLFEVTPEKEIVWEYYCEYSYRFYRAYRVPPEWVPGNPSEYALWEE